MQARPGPAEAVLADVHLLLVPIQAEGTGAQRRANAGEERAGLVELAAVGVVQGRLPVAGRVRQRRKGRGVRGAFPQAGDGFEGLKGFAGLEHGPDLGQGQLDEHVAEAADAGVRRGGQGGDAVQVLPGGLDVVVPQGLLGPLDVPANDVAAEGPDAAGPGRHQAVVEAVRLLGPAVLEGLPRLVLDHPRRFAHALLPKTPPPAPSPKAGGGDSLLPLPLEGRRAGGRGCLRSTAATEKHKAVGGRTVVIPPTAVVSRTM